MLGLSRGFRDDPWLANVAGPRLRAWTAQHHWPLLLVTPVGGVPTVRVSTDHDSPISVDRFVPGEPMPLAGSAAGALQCAWLGARVAAGAAIFAALALVNIVTGIGFHIANNRLCRRYEYSPVPA